MIEWAKISWPLCKLPSHYLFSRVRLKWRFSWHLYLSSLDWCYSDKPLRQVIDLYWAHLWGLLLVGIFTINFCWLTPKEHLFRLHFQIDNWKYQRIYLSIVDNVHPLYIFWSSARTPQNIRPARSSWRILLSICLPFMKLEGILWSNHSIYCRFLSGILC